MVMVVLQMLHTSDCEADVMLHSRVDSTRSLVLHIAAATPASPWEPENLGTWVEKESYDKSRL